MSDAIYLLTVWAKLYQPWCWNFKRHTFTDKGKTSPLMHTMQEIFAQYLDHGWTVAGIERVLRDHITNGGSKKQSVYEILASDQAQAVCDDEANLLSTEKELVHGALYDKGIMKARYTVDDLIERFKGLVEKRPAEKAVRSLIEEFGLDAVLFMLDVAHDQHIQLKTPWGIKLFQEEANARRGHQQALRKAIAAQAQQLKGK